MQMQLYVFMFHDRTTNRSDRKNMDVNAHFQGEEMDSPKKWATAPNFTFFSDNIN